MAMAKSDTTPAQVDEKSMADARAEANGYVLDNLDLRNVKSFQDAFDIASESLGGVEDFADYGTGFTVLDRADKDRLVKTPFVILEWRFNEGDNGEFVSCVVVTEAGEKFILNDGSTGICQQLRNITDERIMAGRPSPQTGLLVRNGLRRSDYETQDSQGKTIKATTYYLA